MVRKFLLCTLFCSLMVSESTWAQLKYIEVNRPDVLTPTVAERTAIGVRIVELLFEGLISQDRMGDWVPELATAIPELKPGSTELIVHIKEDARWPDGRSITAHDVKFSFQVYIDENNNYTNRNIFEVFDRVEVIDQKTVRFVLKRSDRRAVVRTGFHLLPKHLLSSGTYIPETHGFSQRPMGAGPYKVTQSEANRMHFTTNDNYHKSPPPIKEIDLVVNRDENVHMTMLGSGLVDLDPEIRPADVPVILANSNTDPIPYDSKTWFGFAYNFRNQFLRFKEVRQAFTYLFDRRDALNSEFGNYGSVISGPYTASSAYFNGEVSSREYDEIIGEQLLEQAGFVDTDGDGIKDFQGQKVSLTMLLYLNMSQANKNVCTNFVQQLKAHGIEVIVDWQDEHSWYERVFFSRDYDITFVSWKFDDASNIYPLFSRTQMLPGLLNITSFENDRVEELLTRFRFTTNDIERNEVGRELHRILNEELPYTFLWTLQYNAGYRTDRIKRISIDPFYFFRTIDSWEMMSEK
jgi:peptide/nickel transport system substrate-binding protein